MTGYLPPRFLEVSVATQAIAVSLDFYRRLGFEQIPVNDAWPYPYAVVTDGRVFIGLHQCPDVAKNTLKDIPTNHLPHYFSDHSLALTFVVPELSVRLRDLEALGMKFSGHYTGSDRFNHAHSSDPDDLGISLVEARTFSPPVLPAAFASLCGYFTELALPTRDSTGRREFWEKFGFVALDEEPLPFPRQTLTSNLLNLAFYRTRAGRAPWLVFEEPDMGERLEQLRDRGFDLSDEMPDALDAAGNAVLVAPEGTRLLLTSPLP